MASTSSLQKLLTLQQHSFEFFDEYCNLENGLVADSTKKGSPASIAVAGFALACYPVAVERGILSRSQARKRTLAALRFFAAGEQSTRRDATGHHGFYYHFLDMHSGRRAWKSELSTIDTALLLYGVLLCRQYFDRDTGDERELRDLAEVLVERADWRWACGESTLVALSWKPQYGFLKARWSGYNESLLLILLALGVREYLMPASVYGAWCETYSWKKVYGYEYLYAGPLFIHQFPHLWIDFRGIQDAYMREKNSDYFENSRRATCIQQEYCRRNPRRFRGYHEHCWGLTAGDGPEKTVRTIDGRTRRFYDYRARGAPFGPDDGTLAPWAVAASLPFEPDVVLPSLNHIEKTYPEIVNSFGFRCSFNPTFRTPDGYWIAREHLGLDQGPVVLAIENHLTGLPWQLMRGCDYLQRGLQRAGFQGGWLASHQSKS